MSRAAIDAFFASVAAENRAAYAAEPEPTAEQVAQMAGFLYGWARSRPIVKVGGDGNSFWQCGKRMTKLSPKMVAALVAAGHAEPDGGAILRMVR